MADLHVRPFSSCPQWRNDPALIARILFASPEPPAQYNPLYGAVRDLLVLGVPYEQIVEGIRGSNTRASEQICWALPLIRDHFAGVSPAFYQTIDKRYYPVGRGLMSIRAAMIYGVGVNFISCSVSGGRIRLPRTAIAFAPWSMKS